MNRYKFIKYMVILFFSIIVIRLFYISIIRNDYYSNKLDSIVNSSVLGKSAPRGRIYDRNNNILVDNVGIKSIYYKRTNGMSILDEVDIASNLTFLDLNYNLVTESMLKDLWLVLNSGDEKISDTEWNDLKTRKITNSDIILLKRERITNIELESIDTKTAYIYYLMHNGYSYEEKLIKENASEYEYAVIMNDKGLYKGVIPKISWERKYIYGDTLRGIFGNISSSKIGITSDLKDYYLDKGYELTDRVGLTGLEYQYEDYLKGKKAIYKNNKLVSEEERGNDLVLTIDINLQLELEKIVTEELIKAKKEPNTEYLNKAYAVISDPNTGDILAITAKIIVDNEVYDYTSHILSSSITVGSVIKGASISVGYKTGVIDIGTTMKDECIKLMSTPLKCSWNRKGLGNLTDIDALRLSSNSYQFKIAMLVANKNYYYNMPFSIENNAFEIYRNMFNSYGLGVKTEIDLPNESIGIVGENDTPGLLLDYSIGQYDTYTLLQLIQYINTIANNGNRLKLNLVKNTSNYERKVTILNKIDLEDKYIDRIRLGFKEVLDSRGLGYGYINKKYNPAGKTGTSQSFLDTDNDGIIDKETITSTFAGFAPFDNPKMSIVVVTPDVSHIYGSGYMSLLNKRITSRISDEYLKNIDKNN